MNASLKTLRFSQAAWLRGAPPVLRSGVERPSQCLWKVSAAVWHRPFSDMSEGVSAASDMPLLARALHNYGLIHDPSAMDASVISADCKDAMLWPDGQSVQVENLPEAHRTIYSSVANAACVIGINTKEVQAVAQLPQGLQLMSQGGAVFYGCSVISDDITTAATSLKQKEQVRLLMLQDIGKAYVIGNSLGAAFTMSWYLQKACNLQLLVGDHDLTVADQAIWKHTNNQTYLPDFSPGVEWPAVKAGVQRHFLARPLKELEKECVSEETRLRYALAKCHRELADKGYDELTWNHCSVLFGDDMLITPGDCLWDDIMPADLLLGSKNVTANILHSAIYDATSAKAVVHTHAPGIEAVSCTKGGFNEPKGSPFDGRVAYHRWQGISDDSAECEVIREAIEKVPNCVALIAENHGTFTWGSSVEEALERHNAMESACLEQLRKVDNKYGSTWMSSGQNSHEMRA